MAPRRAAIAGIHEYPLRRAPGVSKLQIKAESAARALEDAGLTFADVDALYDAGETGPMSGLAVAEHLGIEPTVVDTTSVGGSSYEFHAAHAARDIAAGRARVALLTYGSTAKSESRAIGTGARPMTEPLPGANMEVPYGLPLIGNYALVAQRHMHEYGTTPEQLAEIAVTTRAHAVRNPEAVTGLADIGIRNTGEIGVDDVLGSRMVADPLHLLDCCLVTDGGGAVVIVGEDVVADTRKPPVWILGSGEALAYPGNARDITTSAAAVSGPIAFGEAGVRPEDVDIAMIYDSFTITVLTLLEDLGFAKKGEGGPYVEGGRMRFDRPGAPALNTDGGGLSSNHPGMRGIFLLLEAARQLRGESTSQVDGARLAVAHGNGGLLGTRHAAATVVLGRD
ncbi:thiolase C-terminal domain-containing protein [Pseudonocardia nigra]|uniref:thiolase C-terminal domain-containing protein n=1 Tax=Pseudonocardia nigra TaxID=1921578 RepID=UPI001C5F2849|nr:thiolase [Pseudonocardia nigra]